MSKDTGNGSCMLERGECSIKLLGCVFGRDGDANAAGDIRHG